MLPFSLAELKAENNEKDPELRKRFEDICAQLSDENHPCRPFSARYYDRDRKPLYSYFGVRWADDKTPKTMIMLSGDLSEQYKDRSNAVLQKGLRQGRKIVHDGIGKDLRRLLHVETQALCSVIQPTRTGPELRHEYNLAEPNPRVMRYVVGEDGEKEERKGVFHLVHGWIQQVQKKKGLFMSSPMTKSGNALGAIKGYYRNTTRQAKMLEEMFEAEFPEYYGNYRAAFDAGVTVDEDKGPWLGRAIIWKLDGALHTDRKDYGPAACVPFGLFTGGQMLVPQLMAKFSYKSGDVCLFESSHIWHKVAPFSPTPHDPNRKDGLTPGRISTVFFFPEASYDILKDKPKGWADATNHGRWRTMEELVD
ncbi:hypothetical protein AX14_004777 [Amanita brunnescens Koide BX004]|nr:hypothetical protein AX14_004777 [Amanita brunnescens Koide BX004]